MKKTFLLPRMFRPLGMGLSGIGAVLAAIRFWFGLKPDWLNLEVLAVYSYYVNSKVLSVVRNQFLEEIAGLFIILGLFFMIVARERDESPDLDRIRGRAFLISAYVCTTFLILSMLFTFGFAFGFIMILNLGLWQLTYFIVFLILRVRQNGSDRTV